MQGRSRRRFARRWVSNRPTELIEHADMALLRAKALGKARIEPAA